MNLCPSCGFDIDVLVECVNDTACWENRAIAYHAVKNCGTCKSLVKEELRKKKEAVKEGCTPVSTANS